MFNGEGPESENFIEELMSKYDDTNMPLPDIEGDPQLLISKVRKHYMEYLIKLLSENYETNQQLVNKNIYLPSAIWRCAKQIEMTAARASMVIQLYRKSIVSVVKEVTKDTKKKRLNKKLYECLHIPPQNEKKTQTAVTSGDMTCECICKQKSKRRKHTSNTQATVTKAPNALNIGAKNTIPVNSQVEQSQAATPLNKSIMPEPAMPPPLLVNQTPKLPLNPRISVDSQESDELLLQLEKLFQSDPNDDDLFDSALCDFTDCIGFDTKKTQNDAALVEPALNVGNDSEIEDLNMSSTDNTMVVSSAPRTQSLDERLAAMAGIIEVEQNNPIPCEVTKPAPKPKQPRAISKWLCEEYYQKYKFLERLVEIGDQSRKKLAKLKELLTKLFGEDSDDEAAMSPLEETPEFIMSCKERIAPWVVKLLTPYYLKGRIRGKTLFKALAKHLIKLICQFGRYPKQEEVKNFVLDFMQSHSLIRTEADFKNFRIENF